MTERLLREALEDNTVAIDALRVLRRGGDRDGFVRVLRAHARARDEAQTVWVIDLADMRFWYQYTNERLHVWADVALVDSDFAHIPPTRHYSNAHSKLRALFLPTWPDSTAAWLTLSMERLYETVFDNALLELERQRAIVTLLEAEEDEDLWVDHASPEDRTAYYNSILLASRAIGSDEYEDMSLQQARAWLTWTRDPKRPWSKTNVATPATNAPA
jgi:hypothetical protein